MHTQQSILFSRFLLLFAVVAVVFSLLGGVMISDASDDPVGLTSPTNFRIDLKDSSDTHYRGTITKITAFPGSPASGDIVRFTAAAASITAKDTDGSTNKNSAVANDMFRYDGTNWVFMGNGTSISSDVDNITKNTRVTLIAKSDRAYGITNLYGSEVSIVILGKDGSCSAGASAPGTGHWNAIGVSNTDYHSNVPTEWRSSRGVKYLDNGLLSGFEIELHVPVSATDGAKCFVAGFGDGEWGSSDYANFRADHVSSTFELTLDTSASTPSLSIASGIGTATPTVQISNLEDKGRVRLYTASGCGSGALGSGDTAVGSTGTVSIALTGRSNSDTFYAKHRDPAGNTTCTSAGLVNSPQTAAPTGLDLDSTTDSGADDNITNNTTPKITFTAPDSSTIAANFTTQPAGSSVANSIPVSTGSSGTLATTTVSGGTDTYVLTLPTLSADGGYTVSLTAQTSGVPVSAAASYTFTLDTAAPTGLSVGLSTAAPFASSDRYINNAEKAATATLVGAVNATGHSATLDRFVVIGSTADCDSTTTSFDTKANTTAADAATDGAYKICYRASDAAGNYAYAASTDIFTRDTTAPTFSFSTNSSHTNGVTHSSDVYLNAADTVTLNVGMVDVNHGNAPTLKVKYGTGSESTVSATSNTGSISGVSVLTSHGSLVGDSTFTFFTNSITSEGTEVTIGFTKTGSAVRGYLYGCTSSPSITSSDINDANKCSRISQFRIGATHVAQGTFTLNATHLTNMETSRGLVVAMVDETFVVVAQQYYRALLTNTYTYTDTIASGDTGNLKTKITGITDAAGNAATDQSSFTDFAIGGTSGNNYIADTTAPTASVNTSNITFNGKNTVSNVTYLNAGDEIFVPVSFSENMAGGVNIVVLFMDDGTSLSGSSTAFPITAGSNSVSVGITISSNQNVDDGDLQFDIIYESGITDIAGNALNAFTAVDLDDIVIDTTAPDLDVDTVGLRSSDDSCADFDGSAGCDFGSASDDVTNAYQDLELEIDLTTAETLRLHIYLDDDTNKANDTTALDSDSDFDSLSATTVTTDVDYDPSGTSSGSVTTKSLYLRAEDRAGNTANSDTFTLTIDREAPTAPDAPDLHTDTDSAGGDGTTTDDLTNFATVVFSLGTHTTASQCRFLFEGTYADASANTCIGASISHDHDNDGTPTTYPYASTYTNSTEQEEHFKTRAYDTAGNHTDSTAHSVHFDRTITAATFDLVATSDTGYSNTDNITNDATPEISLGSLESSSTPPTGTGQAAVEVYTWTPASTSDTSFLDGTGTVQTAELGTALTSISNATSATMNRTLSAQIDGIYRIVTKHTDDAGNIAWTATPATTLAYDATATTGYGFNPATATNVLIIDTEKPAAPGTPDLSPARDTFGQHNNPARDGTSTDNITKEQDLAFFVDSAVRDFDDTSDLTGAVLARERHHIALWEFDTATYTSGTTTETPASGQSITINSVARTHAQPNLTSTDGTATTNIATATAITNAGFLTADNTRKGGLFTHRFAGAVADTTDDYYLAAKQIDAAGNTSDYGSVTTITIDRDAPRAPRQEIRLHRATDTGNSNTDGRTTSRTPILVTKFPRESSPSGLDRQDEHAQHGTDYYIVEWDPDTSNGINAADFVYPSNKQNADQASFGWIDDRVVATAATITDGSGSYDSDLLDNYRGSTIAEDGVSVRVKMSTAPTVNQYYAWRMVAVDYAGNEGAGFQSTSTVPTVLPPTPTTPTLADATNSGVNTDTITNHTTVTVNTTYGNRTGSGDAETAERTGQAAQHVQTLQFTITPPSTSTLTTQTTSRTHTATSATATTSPTTENGFTRPTGHETAGTNQNFTALYAYRGSFDLPTIFGVPAADLPDGDYTFSVLAINTNNETGTPTSPLTVTVDTTAPTIGTITDATDEGTAVGDTRHLKVGDTITVNVPIADEHRPATAPIVKFRFGDSDTDRVTSAGTGVVATETRQVGTTDGLANLVLQEAAGGIRINSATDTAQTILQRFFRSVDPNAEVSVSSNQVTITSSVIHTLPASMRLANYVTATGAYFDEDNPTFTSVTKNGNTITATYELIFFDADGRTVVPMASSRTYFLAGSVGVVATPVTTTYPYTYDVVSGDNGVLQYMITRVADGAANSMVDQTTFTDVSSVLADTTAPTMTLIRDRAHDAGDKDDTVYVASASDTHLARIVSKDGVASGSCTAASAITTYTDYVNPSADPPVTAEAVTADNSAGRCFIAVDRAGNQKSIFADDDATVTGVDVGIGNFEVVDEDDTGSDAEDKNTSDTTPRFSGTTVPNTPVDIVLNEATVTIGQTSGFSVTTIATQTAANAIRVLSGDNEQKILQRFFQVAVPGASVTYDAATNTATVTNAPNIVNVSNFNRPTYYLPGGSSSGNVSPPFSATRTASGITLTFTDNTFETLVAGSLTSIATERAFFVGTITTRGPSVSVTSDASGQFTTASTSVLDQGTHSLKGYVTINSVRSGPFALGDLTIDTVAPVITFTDAVAEGPVTSDTVAVTVTSGDAFGGFAYSDDRDCGSGDTYSGTNTTLTINTETNNGNYVCAKATDTAGNTTYEPSLQQVNVHDVNVDRTDPTVQVFKIGSGNSATYVASAQDTNPITAIYKDDTASGSCVVGAYAAPPTVPSSWTSYDNDAPVALSADNTNGLCIIFADAAGNTVSQHISDAGTYIEGGIANFAIVSDDDSGQSNTDRKTNVSTPRFTGDSIPGSAGFLVLDRDVGETSTADTDSTDQTGAGLTAIGASDDAQSVLLRFFRQIDPSATVTVSTDAITLTSSVIAGFSGLKVAKYDNDNAHAGTDTAIATTSVYATAGGATSATGGTALSTAIAAAQAASTESHFLVGTVAWRFVSITPSDYGQVTTNTFTTSASATIPDGDYTPKVYIDLTDNGADDPIGPATLASITIDTVDPTITTTDKHYGVERSAGSGRYFKRGDALTFTSFTLQTGGTPAYTNLFLPRPLTAVELSERVYSPQVTFGGQAMTGCSASTGDPYTITCDIAFTLNSSVAEGVASLEVVATDIAGNELRHSDSRYYNTDASQGRASPADVIIDNTPPTRSATIDKSIVKAGDTVTVTVNAGDTHGLFVGTAALSETNPFRVTFDGQTHDFSAFPATFTHTFSRTAASGSRSISLPAILDPAGNTLSSVEQPLTFVDSGVPSISSAPTVYSDGTTLTVYAEVNRNNSDAMTGDEAVTFAFTGACAEFPVSPSFTDPAQSGTRGYKYPIAVPVGTYASCGLTVTDEAGNQSVAKAIPFEVVVSKARRSSGGGGGGGGSRRAPVIPWYQSQGVVGLETALAAEEGSSVFVSILSSLSDIWDNFELGADDLSQGGVSGDGLSGAGVGDGLSGGLSDDLSGGPSDETPPPVQPPVTSASFSLPLSGDAIKLLQQTLNYLEFTVATRDAGSPGEETTVYGPLTQDAVKRFQQSADLPGTGVFDAETRCALLGALDVPDACVSDDAGSASGSGEAATPPVIMSEPPVAQPESGSSVSGYRDSLRNISAWEKRAGVAQPESGSSVSGY